jgi:protein arginine kinase
VAQRSEVDAWMDALLRNHRLPTWLSGDAPESDVVVSSRVRLARNFAGLPFPGAATRRQLLVVTANVRRILPPEFEERSLVGDAERSLLIGSRLLSPDHALDSVTRSVFVAQDRSASVMANEEDHLRIQSVAGGLDTVSAGKRTQALADGVAQHLPMAATADRGYLVAWPGNAGKGMRIGVMLHLGALAIARKRPVVPDGFALRGFLGEGSRGLGGFVQVSSTQRSERELLDYVRVLIENERKARETTVFSDAEALSDLKSEEELSAEKAVEVVSKLRLRAALDRHPSRSIRDFDALLAVLDVRSFDGQSASLKRRSLICRFLELSLPWQQN